ncbi:MAG: hypothetical protein HQM08_29250 [Candidatus Riflebacteria bacterium]|nr:hypothetical protein [Candidatus Riflebacteria bacterium]
MTIKELTKKIKQSIRSAKDKDDLLLKAGIIDKKGNFFSKYFSAETIKKDQEHQNL